MHKIYTPYLARTGELWSVFYEYLREKKDSYKDTLQYYLMSAHPRVIFDDINWKCHSGSSGATLNDMGKFIMC